MPESLIVISVTSQLLKKKMGKNISIRKHIYAQMSVGAWVCGHPREMWRAGGGRIRKSERDKGEAFIFATAHAPTVHKYWMGHRGECRMLYLQCV